MNDPNIYPKDPKIDWIEGFVSKNNIEYQY